MLRMLLRRGMRHVRLDVMRRAVGALPGRGVVSGWSRRAACACMPCRDSLS